MNSEAETDASSGCVFSRVDVEPKRDSIYALPVVCHYVANWKSKRCSKTV